MGLREIEIAGNKLIIHELDDLYDPVTARALTGSWIWDSALVLSDYIATQGQLDFNLKGKTVLELGAGAGLPGLTAALLGASRVMLTDVDSLLPGLRKNVEVNGLGDRVEVKELVWGSDESLSQLGDEFGEFDLVLMSDVFYDVDEMVGLVKTLKKVCGRETRVWAASEVRPWTSECLNGLVSEGFGVVDLPSRLGSSCSEVSGWSCLEEFAVFHIVPPSEDKPSEDLSKKEEESEECYMSLDCI